MKQKLKTILKLVTLLLLIILSSCQKDLYENTNPNQYKIKEYSFQKAIQIPKFNLENSKVMYGMNKFQKSNRSANKSQLSEIIVDSTTVKEITLGEYTTYTMLVKPQDANQEFFDNLVIETIASTQTTNAYIIRYDTSQGIIPIPELNTIAFGAGIENTAKMAVGVKGLDGNGNGSWYSMGGAESDSGNTGGSAGGFQQTCILEMMCNEPWPREKPYEHIATTQCSHPYLKVVCYSTYTTPTGNTSSGSSSTTGPGSNSGSNTSNPVNPTSPVTVVVPPKTIEEIKSDIFKIEFYDLLSLDKKNFLIANNSKYKEIKNYVISSINMNTDGDHIPQDVEDFANDVISRMKNDSTFTSMKPFLIEKQIDDSNLDPCGQNVLASLKNTTVCDIAQVLAKLDANKSDYNTSIKWELITNGDAGRTVKNSNYNYSIKINSFYSNSTKLFRASLLMHELIHAYFMSIVDDFHSTPMNQNSYDINNFPSLFQAYCDKKYRPSQTVAQNTHHLEMAQYYVDAIARALQEYQTGVPVPNGTTPNQIYLDLAWAGLNDTPIFDLTYPIDNPNRIRILNRGTCEQMGYDYQGQTVVGSPCN